MTDAHSRPSGDAPEPLYDVNVPTPTHAERARTLVAQISTGTLCTLALEPAGYPYGSFVTVAFDEGNPVFLISALAEHTKNLEQDPRASLLVAESGAADPLANGRVTMLGPCTRVEGDGGSARAAFLAVHPNCRLLRRLSRLRVLEAAREFRPLHRRLRTDVVDQQGRVAGRRARSARPVSGRHHRSHERRPRRRDGALLQGVFESDRYHLRDDDRHRSVWLRDVGEDHEGPRPVRLAFARPVSTPEDARAALIAMLKDARSKLG